MTTGRVPQTSCKNWLTFMTFMKELLVIIRELLVVVSAIVIPFVIGYSSNSLTEALKDKEVRLRTVELAITILQQPITENGKDSTAIREWAMTVIDTYSGIPIPPGARRELQYFNFPWKIIPEGWSYDGSPIQGQLKSDNFIIEPAD
ncbi:hypothetical protein O4H49_13110 [Kiloniella laminariae]|uniref:Type II secretion system protein GspG C-terminal domain-containing protein n=1 Tax=Kiloniella laminariae TaxID=454162 RepID=A0ABT4LKT4_9PROT|nr:hypothetical protein [Kiloniella laminariae]MCZ4281723.1 hypothetical protein [Kiloniella laminariae]